jgi:protein TonB
MAVIVAGHAAAIAMAMLVTAPKLDVEKPEPILVSLLTEQHSEPSPPPPPVQPLPVVMPDVVVPPLISIVVPHESPPITVVANPVPPAPPAPAPPSPPVSKSDSTEPVMATSVEYVRAPLVSYPAAAKQARATGTVHIRAVVETDGHVREVRVDRSSGHASLDKAAGESVMGALFRPYMHNGVPRAAIVIVPVDFSLKTRGGSRPGRGRPDDHCGKPRHRDDDQCRPDRGPPPQTLSQAAVRE